MKDIAQRAADIADHEDEQHHFANPDDHDWPAYWLRIYNQALLELATAEEI